MFLVSWSTDVRFNPQFGQEIGMLRIFVSQRGQRLPAWRRNAQMIKPAKLVQSSAVTMRESYLAERAAPTQKTTKANKQPVCNTTLRYLNES
jgi:hypothetical protein